MRLHRRVLPLAAAALLLGASAAQAAPVSATADDPRDGTTTAARDLQQVRTSFDADAGRWTVTVRLWAPANEEEWAMVNARLWIPGGTNREGPCGGELRDVAYLRASTRPSTTSVSGTAGAYGEPNPWGGTGPSTIESATKSVADGEVTLTGQDPRLVGRTAACVTLSLSYQNQLQDSIAGGIRFPGPEPSGPGDPQPQPQPQPQPAPAPAPFTASALRLVSPTLRAGRDAKVTVRLRPLDRAITGTARLRAARGRTVLATGTWRARAGRTVVARLKLTKAGRRAARRHRRVSARLVVAARPAGAVVVRTLAVRLHAPRRRVSSSSASG